MTPVTKQTIRIVQKGSGIYKRFIHNLGHLLFDRNALLVIGLLILTVAADVVKDLYSASTRPGDDVEVMMREVEGISNLFLGIGLILKERRLLRIIFGLAQIHESPLESWRDDICQRMGLCLLLNGTAMRLTAQLIRIPEHIIPTQGLEYIIFFVGLVFCLLASAILSYLLCRLIFVKESHCAP